MKGYAREDIRSTLFQKLKCECEAYDTMLAKKEQLAGQIVAIEADLALKQTVIDGLREVIKMLEDYPCEDRK